MNTNYGAPHQPKIVQMANGGVRNSIRIPAVDSEAIYMGAFVGFATGAHDTPSGIEFGVKAIADDDHIGGFVIGFYGKDSDTPLQEDSGRQGAITDMTGELPWKYTFSSTNDESNTTSADLETVEIMPICPGDILEVTLWGGAAISVVRGTTTAAGTTTSSANIGVAMAVATTYPWALLESGAAVTFANNDFVTTTFNGKKPANPRNVYVQCIRSFAKLNAPD